MPATRMVASALLLPAAAAAASATPTRLRHHSSEQQQQKQLLNTRFPAADYNISECKKSGTSQQKHANSSHRSAAYAATQTYMIASGGLNGATGLVHVPNVTGLLSLRTESRGLRLALQVAVFLLSCLCAAVRMRSSLLTHSQGSKPHCFK